MRDQLSNLQRSRSSFSLQILSQTCPQHGSVRRLRANMIMSCGSRNYEEVARHTQLNIMRTCNATGRPYSETP